MIKERENQEKEMQIEENMIEGEEKKIKKSKERLTEKQDGEYKPKLAIQQNRKEDKIENLDQVSIKKKIICPIISLINDKKKKKQRI